MKKTNDIWNLEESLYNPKPNIKNIKFERIENGLYKYKSYYIHRKNTRNLGYQYEFANWDIIRNNKYIITVRTLNAAKEYFLKIKGTV
tara:strand:- start:3912 stop:4175 length:264 start_codon:yes stop_codon:yes gene_type:complete